MKKFTIGIREADELNKEHDSSCVSSDFSFENFSKTYLVSENYLRNINAFIWNQKNSFLYFEPYTQNFRIYFGLFGNLCEYASTE